MFGMTGSGKSALGNLLAGYDHFQSGDDTASCLKQPIRRLWSWWNFNLDPVSLTLQKFGQASVTNNQSVLKYEAPDRSLVVLLGQDQIGVDLSSLVCFCLNLSTSSKWTTRLDTIGLGDTEIDQDKLLADSRRVLGSIFCPM